MLKPELEKLVRQAEIGIGESLRAMRSEGKCFVCGAIEGVKHEEKCAAWPLIMWRKLRHEMEEEDARM